MKHYRAKPDFPTTHIRRYLEPGPVVLVSSAWAGQRNVMTMGWHMMLGFEPALVGCLIDSGNISHAMIRQSRQCVINIPTAEMVDIVVGIGNCDGNEADKFDRFALTATPGQQVQAPLIDQCFASLECVIHDDSMIDKRDLFILKVVKAHVAPRPKYPKTLHYRGQGIFTADSGRAIDRRAGFTKWRDTDNF